jgi:Putative prokaryotic signal transducing protein
MELVTVTTVSDQGLANVVVGVLQQAGVEAVVGGPGAPDVYPMPSIHPYRILVSEDDMPRAREVLDQLEAMPEEADEEE